MRPKPRTQIPRIWFLLSSAVIIALTVLFLVLLLRPRPPRSLQSGEIYMRAGLPDSALIATIRESVQSPASDLLVTILAFDRLIQVDRTGACEEIVDGYDAGEDVMALPLHLPEQVDCFSYRISFDIPTQQPDIHIPLHLAFVHPLEDRDLLSPTEQR